MSDVNTIQSRKQHWEGVYQRNDYTQVLWHQDSVDKSLEYIKNYTDLNSNIIDVGCGASILVDKLIEEGYKNISLLDTSNISLEITKNRLKSNDVKYICDDILNFKTDEKFDLWHDRAVFHFLEDANDRQKYFSVLNDTLKPGAIAIISTFMSGGDLKCAGLDVVQYDNEKILKEVPKNIELLNSEEYIHITPKKTKQKYIYFVFRKL